MSLLHLPCPTDLIGDLSAEIWPRYLRSETYVHMAFEAIGQQDFLVEPYGYAVVGDRVKRFLVGENGWSRKLAIHLDDPKGIVYILKDDGTDWFEGSRFNLKPVTTVKAITLGALLSDSYPGIKAHLDSDEHRNRRLAGPPILGQQIAQPQGNINPEA